MKRMIVVTLLALLGFQLAAAQDEISPELEAQMDALEAATIAIRGLDGESVTRDFPTRPEVIAYLEETFETTLPPDEVERYTNFYIALGLLESGLDLRGVYLELLGTQIAGFYDTETQVMNVVPIGGETIEELSLMEQIVYVHEYTHALQDQFYDLDTLMPADDADENLDRALAQLALVEGDATAVMSFYTQEVASRNPLAALGLLAEGVAAGNLALPESVPDILARELLFPYEGGLEFVLALYNEGGWEAVDAAYANVPVSSEQILHPDKYLAGEAPQPVTLDDASATLGEGWTRIWDTTLGEWYLREHLRTGLDNREAGTAAQGWGGDRLHIYENGGQLAWALAATWDTPQDAEEFLAAYEMLAEARFGGAAADGCWSDAEAAVCIAAGETTRISQAPTLEAARALLG